MSARLPGWIARPPSDEPGDGVASLTPDERLARFVDACELARAILEHRPDVEEVLARRVPLSPESEQLWRRLVIEGRRARAAR